jgi:4'-phosphopantetheinyl transferase EntD
MLLDSLLDPRVSVCESRLDTAQPALYPEELSAVASAVEKRRREFAAGRACARAALKALGIPPVAIPAGDDRAPIWPGGIAGSISHSSTWCVAAVARHSDGIRSVGIDIEEATPLDELYQPDICTETERDWLSRQPADQRGLLLKVMFSAKECAYKCQYPLTRTLVGYHAMSIMLQADAGEFSATFEGDIGVFKAGDRLAGRFALTRGHIITAMVLS